MTENMCEECVYWRNCSGFTSHKAMACHYLLDTGHRRKEIDGVCVSKVKMGAKHKPRRGDEVME